jgi:hypothetical protein
VLLDPGLGRHAPWEIQARQAIKAWIAAAQADLAVTLSRIRDLPSLGADVRQLQRESLEAFILLVRDLTDTPELRAAGVAPPSRQLMVMLLGGLRELIATAVEDGGDIGGITEVAVRATQALLDPSRRPAPA